MNKIKGLCVKAAMALALTTAAVSAVSLTTEPMTVQADGYHQGEAKRILKMVNKLRKPSNAWYLNEGNAKVYAKNLRPLKWDKELEEVAKIRARELVGNFAHDNFNHFSQKFGYKAENIAMGQRSAKEVFTAWCEEKESYAGQGHRRNMLGKDYTMIGIGCYESGGRKYWVQVFGAVGAKADQGTTKGKPVKNSGSGGLLGGMFGGLFHQDVSLLNHYRDSGIQ